LNEERKRTIKEPTFCRQCGYNLQQLPLYHVCPECGHRYDTRHGRTDGIFEADEIAFPLLEVIGTILGLGMVAVAIAGIIKTKNITILFIAVIFTFLSCVFGFNAMAKVQKYNHARKIIQRMDEEL
jgi:predicted RNA-binding Zn-ribbon protein involved in translation (DUF1610 family)